MVLERVARLAFLQLTIFRRWIILCKLISLGCIYLAISQFSVTRRVMISIQFSVDVQSSDIQGVLGQSSQCSNSIIGTNDEMSYNRNTTKRLYLNLNSSAECIGTIFSYRYCYYQPSTSVMMNSRYSAVVAVYRLINNVYQPLSGAELTIDVRNPPSGTLVCDNTAILTIPIQLQLGDVVGACTIEPSASGQTSQLDLVGQSANGSTLYSASNIQVGCARNAPPPDVSVQDLSPPLTSTILHLSAIISKSLQYVH